MGPLGTRQGGSSRNPGERSSEGEKCWSPPREVVQEDRRKFHTSILNHRHKSLKGSTILFSVVGNFRLLFKNKIREVQNSQSNKAGNNSTIPKHWAILQASEEGRGQVSSSHNKYRETAVLKLVWILGDYVLYLRQFIF